MRSDCLARRERTDTPLHLTAPGLARARPSRAVLSLTRVPQVSGKAVDSNGGGSEQYC
jgi:hypothetical protein